MNYTDIIILGPTSSGKSALANFIATYSGNFVFNCDAIQVYKDLNKLTNKPKFTKQELINDEVVSYTKPSPEIDVNNWKDFNFQIYIKRKDSQISINNFDKTQEFFRFIAEQKIDTSQSLANTYNIPNYLFDIKNPTNAYSLADFRSDIARISKHQKLDSKIIVGGTIYYAYHYIFGTVFGNDFDDYENIKSIRDEVSNIKIEELIAELRNLDPDSLSIIDLKNKQRVAKAVEFIRRTGNKFSEKYYKETLILEDYLVIIILPKDKEKFYQKLDSIVQNRINKEALNEIEFLIDKYGEKVKEWLSSLSYEYKYGIEMLECKGDSIKVNNLLNELKIAERHYAKRQMTFLRKLEKDLTKNINR